MKPARSYIDILIWKNLHDELFKGLLYFNKTTYIIVFDVMFSIIVSSVEVNAVSSHLFVCYSYLFSN